MLPLHPNNDLLRCAAKKCDFNSEKVSVYVTNTHTAISQNAAFLVNIPKIYRFVSVGTFTYRILGMLGTCLYPNPTVSAPERFRPGGDAWDIAEAGPSETMARSFPMDCHLKIWLLGCATAYPLVHPQQSHMELAACLSVLACHMSDSPSRQVAAIISSLVLKLHVPLVGLEAWSLISFTTDMSSYSHGKEKHLASSCQRMVCVKVSWRKGEHGASLIKNQLNWARRLMANDYWVVIAQQN